MVFSCAMRQPIHGDARSDQEEEEETWKCKGFLRGIILKNNITGEEAKKEGEGTFCCWRRWNPRTRIGICFHDCRFRGKGFCEQVDGG